jgi:hypothetical protein
MLAPQEVQKMLALTALGWGARRISRVLCCKPNSGRQYLRQSGRRRMDVGARAGVLQPQRYRLVKRLRQHRGDAGVVRQGLVRAGR